MLPAAVSSVTYNAADRITARTTPAGGTVTPVWDNNGNLLCDNGTGSYGGGNVSCNAGGNSYSLDSRNRLTSLVSPSVGTWSYGYDPLGRRQVNAGPSLTGTSYLYDGWNVARESTVAGTTTANLLNGPGLDERYIRGEISGSTTTSVAYLTDALGSTVALAKNGAAQTFYGYDPFGGQATPTGVADGNPYAFTGAQLDVTGLQYQRYRCYSPALGRFISEDPIGLNGGINRYAYVGNSPVNSTDPFGLSSLVYSQSTNTLTVYSDDGPYQQFPAYNNTTDPATDPNSAGPYPQGNYPYTGQTHHYDDNAPPPASRFGPYGGFHFPRQDCPGCEVHSGRSGPTSKTQGCIRTNDDAMSQIQDDINAGDPPDQLTVGP